MGILEGFLWGIAGGMLAELLGWHKLRQISSGDYPVWAKTWAYWLITICMILAGGVLVVAYLRSGAKVNALVAINLGASAPLILGSFASQAPRISPGTID